MKSFLLSLSLVTLFGSASFAQLAQGPAAGSVPSGVQVNTNNFDANASVLNEGPPFREANKLHIVPTLPDPANLPPPTGPAGSNYYEDPSVHRGTAPPSVPPITLGSFQGISQTNFLPPDPHIAVGPNHIIAIVNSTFRIYDKSGNILKTINCGAWLNSALPGVGPSDPKVDYDHFAGRWVMSWIETDDISRGTYLVSVSDDDNPIGIWYNYALPSTLNGTTNSGFWADYQGMGFDNQAVYLTSNQFSFSGFAQYVKIRIIPKAALYANTGGSVGWMDLWDVRDQPGGNRIFTLRPAITFGVPGVFYLIANSRFITSTYFTLYRITDPITTPVLTAITVPVVASTPPPNAGQLGGSTTIPDIGRIYEPVYLDSSLWVSHSVASATGYSDIRYVRINTVTNSAVEDVAFGADGYFHFYPAIMVDKDKNVAITCSRSAFTEYAGCYFTWRLNTDPPGLRPLSLTQAGQGYYTGGRWGDYLGAALDPSDRNNFWLISEYAATGNSWGTLVHGTRLVPFSGIRIFTSSQSVNFGKVEAGFTSDTSTITISNIGTNVLTISSITKTQPTYTLLNLPSFPVNIASFDSLKFRVVFTPTAHGTINDTITIASNDPITPAMKISLTAKGIVIGRAQAGVMYATSGTPSQLYTINTTTGAATPVGPTGVASIDGLAIRALNKELYGALSTGSSATLYRMSRQYGDALLTRTINIPNLRAITFSLTGDTLYGGTNIGRLYRINITTGDTTYIGTANGKVYSGFAISPTSNQLWASVRPPLIGRDSIFIVNRSTGSAITIGRTGLNLITPYIAFNKQGTLFALIGSGAQTNTLYSLDTLTATGTLIGSTGVAGLQAIAMRTDSSGSVDVDEGTPSGIPETFVLSRNYPNPFNPATQIRYGLPVQSMVSVTIYNIMGQEITRLYDGSQSAGYHEVVWNGLNAKGVSVASGIYLYKLEARGENRTFSETKRMLLLK
ncbi:MAG: hypothetical protein HW412_769 [Bacteroidetes bacterium]|nr:hypothetical protein [Bacteroidota bacterium]